MSQQVDSEGTVSTIIPMVPRRIQEKSRMSSIALVPDPSEDQVVSENKPAHKSDAVPAEPAIFNASSDNPVDVKVDGIRARSRSIEQEHLERAKAQAIDELLRQVRDVYGGREVREQVIEPRTADGMVQYRCWIRPDRLDANESEKERAARDNFYEAPYTGRWITREGALRRLRNARERRITEQHDAPRAAEIRPTPAGGSSQAIDAVVRGMELRGSKTWYGRAGKNLGKVARYTLVLGLVFLSGAVVFAWFLPTMLEHLAESARRISSAQITQHTQPEATTRPAETQPAARPEEPAVILEADPSAPTRHQHVRTRNVQQEH